MHQNTTDQHGSGNVRKTKSTSSSPQNLFQIGTQDEVIGSGQGFPNMTNASGSHDQKQAISGLSGLSHTGNLLMPSGQVMSSSNVGSSAASKLHSAEKDTSTRNASGSNEFITTTTKYGGERVGGGSSGYDTNEKQPLSSDKLEVTVIPVDEEPYSKIITIPQSMIGYSSTHGSSTSGPTTINGSAQIQSSINLTSSNSQSLQQYPSLKDIFQAKDSLWKPIYGSFVQVNKQPLFSIFRKKITIKPDSKIQHPQGEEIGLHILFLKCDGNRFPRNAFANQLEVYCSTYFYGPLVLVYGELSPPYKLHSFQTVFLTERIQPLNEEEQKIYPLPFSAKKCSTVRNLMAERKFTMDLDQHEKTMSLEEFMIYSYKTSFCPYINKKHEWSECNYAHRQQDFRRPPHLYFYYLERCSYVQDDGSWEQCPDYLDCQFSHTLVEQLFSPLNYKLRPCPDRVPDQKFQCKKRLDLCCHNHSQDEKNLAIKALRNPPKILPEHESMQDYIDIIDQEGLLNNKQNDDFDENGQAIVPGATKAATTQATTSAGQGVVGASAAQNTQQIQKKAALAKLPEENQDKWRQLEQEMNKQSLQKKDKDGFGSQTKTGNSRDSPETNAFAQLAAAARFQNDQHDQLSNLMPNQPTAAAQQTFNNQFGSSSLPGQQIGQGTLANMSFLDSDAIAQAASGSSVKPINSLASIIDISPADGFDGQGVTSNTGHSNIMSELDALDDEVLSKMKKRKSHHYGGTSGAGPAQLGAQFGGQDSVGILGGLAGQRQEPREDDYVQQMIKANSTHNYQFMSKNGSLKPNALGNSLTSNEQIKVLKAEVRKGKKKVKKSVKVQEFSATNSSAPAKGPVTPGEGRKDSSPEQPHQSTANESNSVNQNSSCSQSASFHTAYNMSVHTTNANGSVPAHQESPLPLDPSSLDAPQNLGAKVQSYGKIGLHESRNQRASTSIDSKTTRKKNASITTKELTSPVVNFEDDDQSESNNPRQRNQWANDGSMIEDCNDEDNEMQGFGPSAGVTSNDDEQESVMRPMTSQSAQKAVQQLLDCDDKNQSAASSSSKVKQSVSKKSLRSSEPHVNPHITAGRADGSAWKGEDNSALSKKSFTTTPSQQRHKNTLRESQRMQEDLLRVQSVLEEQLIQQVNSRQAAAQSGNPFTVAADSNDAKSLFVVPENMHSTSLKQYQTASPEKTSKLSKKGAAGSKQAQASQNASKNVNSQALAGTDGKYKYARKSLGASTTATGAANASNKMGGAGPSAATGGMYAQRQRPPTNAVENTYAPSRNSVLFKLSERKYKDSSRFCDLQSSSSNAASQDNEGRGVDEVSNESNHFNEKINDEDTQIRNNFTASLWDCDLVLGSGQGRGNDPDSQKQQLTNSSTEGFPQEPPNSLFTFNFLNDEQQTQGSGPIHQVQKAQTPVQQNIGSIAGGGGSGPGTSQKRTLYSVHQEHQASYDNVTRLTTEHGAGQYSRSRAREKQQQNPHIQGGKSSQKLTYKQQESSSILLTQTAQMQQKHEDRLQQQLGQPHSAAAANSQRANVASARNQSSTNNNYK